MVVMVTMQKGFHYIFETLKDRPNTPPSLNLLKQRAHTPLPSPSLDNVVGSKRLTSGRVKL